MSRRIEKSTPPADDARARVIQSRSGLTWIRATPLIRAILSSFYPAAAPTSLPVCETAVKSDIVPHEMLERDPRVFEEKRFNVRPT